MKMIELMGSCGSPVSINPAEILYFHTTKMLDSFGTLMAFKNGKKMVLADDYDYVRGRVQEVQDDDQG